MSAKDYKVTSPYGATYSPWSTSNPHLGEDRAMPCKTRIEVNGTLIGYTGSTGRSSGYHTHTQKVKDNRVYNPRGGGFTVPGPVTIYAVGYNSSIGNYVRYRDAEGVNWSIFHMYSSTVRVGKVIKERDMLTVKAAGVIVRAYIGQTVSAGELKKYVGKVTTNEFIKKVKTWNRYEANIIKAKAGTLVAKNHLMYTIRKEYKEPKYTEYKGTLYKKS